MKTFSQLKNDLSAICNTFNLGNLKSYTTDKNNPIQGYSTAFFTTKESSQIYKYHYSNLQN